MALTLASYLGRSPFTSERAMWRAALLTAFLLSTGVVMATSRPPNFLLLFTDDLSQRLSSGGGELSVMSNVTSLIVEKGASEWTEENLRRLLAVRLA